MEHVCTDFDIDIVWDKNICMYACMHDRLMNKSFYDAIYLFAQWAKAKLRWKKLNRFVPTILIFLSLLLSSS